MPNKPPPVDRKSIQDLVLMFKKFRPLVNEKNEHNGRFAPNPDLPKGMIPDQDEILMTVGHAIVGISTFIKAFDHNRELYTALATDAMMAHAEFDKIGLNPPGLAEGFEHIIGRHKQALDLIESIANDNLSGESIVSRCGSFIQDLKRKNNLVNEKTETNGKQFKVLPKPAGEEDSGSGTSAPETLS